MNFLAVGLEMLYIMLCRNYVDVYCLHQLRGHVLNILTGDQGVFLNRTCRKKYEILCLTLTLILPYFGKIIGWSNETLKLAYSVWTVLYAKRFYFGLVTNVIISIIKLCIVLAIRINSWKGIYWWDEANDGRELIRVSHIIKIRSIGCINVNL